MLANSSYVDINDAAFDFYRVCSQVDAYGCAFAFAAAVVKSSIMFRALDDVAHHQTIGQRRALVSAKAVSSVVFVPQRAIDGVQVAIQLDGDHVFLINVTRVTGLYPVVHRVVAQGQRADRINGRRSMK
jgi:uncharacterized protein YcsI (UPF0317 family)